MSFTRFINRESLPKDVRGGQQQRLPSKGAHNKRSADMKQAAIKWGREYGENDLLQQRLLAV